MTSIHYPQFDPFNYPVASLTKFEKGKHFEPITETLMKGITNTENDEFTFPFLLESKGDYLLWFPKFVKEVKRVFGANEFKHFVNGVKRDDRVSDLPEDMEQKHRVLFNIERLLMWTYSKGISNSFINRYAYLEADLSSFNDFHDEMSHYTGEEYADLLWYWSQLSKDRDQLSEEEGRRILSTFFTQAQLDLLNHPQWSYENRFRLVSELLRRTGFNEKTHKINISKFLYQEAGISED